MPGVELLIAGSGGLREPLQALIDAHTRLANQRASACWAASVRPIKPPCCTAAIFFAWPRASAPKPLAWCCSKPWRTRARASSRRWTARACRGWSIARGRRPVGGGARRARLAGRHYAATAAARSCAAPTGWQGNARCMSAFLSALAHGPSRRNTYWPRPRPTTPVTKSTTKMC